MDDFDVVTGTSPQLKSLKPAVPPPRASSDLNPTDMAKAAKPVAALLDKSEPAAAGSDDLTHHAPA